MEQRNLVFGVSAADYSRLNKQSAAVLARLRRGPATNYELAAIALNYTARITNLRQAGFTINCQRESGKGTTTYTLGGEA